jgi:uncharacterized protein YdeI (YjbR/CyaY-like superfamily)
MNPKVDFFFKKAKNWQKEYEELRMIALSTGLKEELKWGCPCYTSDKKNIVLIHGFKDYCAYLFFKGALLKDPKGILIQQTENVQYPRQVRFTSVKEIVKLQATLKAYIKEAIEIEKSGKKLELKKTADYKVPEEFEARLKESPELKKAFQSLTPGRQRAYLFYFSQPKLRKTRESRIEKSLSQILAGKGLDD